MRMTSHLRNMVEGLLREDPKYTFCDVSIAVYEYQSEHNVTYKRYLELMGYNNKKYFSVEDIPLMPISFFKHYEITSEKWEAEAIFKSSGTTGMQRSQHLVRDKSWYNYVSKEIFASFYPQDYDMLALLPSYLENGDSSLVHMVKHLTGDQDPNRFHLYDFEKLYSQILEKLSTDTDKDVLLWGVTFALLDFVEKYKINDSRLKVIFTGGMKSRGVELDYDSVIEKLKVGFPTSDIAAEYGMTELFSQAYTSTDSLYTPAKTMKVMTKDFNDLTCSTKDGKSGQIGIVDLANLHTISFIQTDDIGRCYDNGQFELMGRVSNSDLRGCNMLYETFTP